MSICKVCGTECLGGFECPGKAAPAIEEMSYKACEASDHAKQLIGRAVNAAAAGDPSRKEVEALCAYVASLQEVVDAARLVTGIPHNRLRDLETVSGG